MTVHVLPPLPDEPPDPVPHLDPFWAAVRRRRPDLPLVLLGDGPGPEREVEGGRAR